MRTPEEIEKEMDGTPYGETQYKDGYFYALSWVLEGDERTCIWSRQEDGYPCWNIGCKDASELEWTFVNDEETPASAGMVFCPCCGLRIEVEPAEPLEGFIAFEDDEQEARVDREAEDDDAFFRNVVARQDEEKEEVDRSLKESGLY